MTTSATFRLCPFYSIFKDLNRQERHVRQGVKIQKHKEALKMIFSAIFLVSGVTFGEKYLDHKDFPLNVKKNPTFISFT